MDRQQTMPITVRLLLKRYEEIVHPSKMLAFISHAKIIICMVIMELKIDGW